MAITAAQEALAVGDSVYRAWDPAQEVGTIVSETPNKAQWIVSFPRGKTWIYPSADLIPAET